MIKFQTKIATNKIDKTIEGLRKASSIITSTMGGVGKNVILSRYPDSIVFTKDGVSVAKDIRFQDPEENIGAQLLINAADKTVNECGDGTTLTSLFTYAFVKQLFEEDRDNINDMLEDMENAIQEVIEVLKNNSKEISNIDDIYKVAFTSCKSSRIAKFIQEIYLKTQLNANISVELSRISNQTHYEITEGLEFENGMLHGGFANQDNGNCIFENPFYIITDSNIQSPDDYAEIIDQLHNKQTPVVFIAPSFSDAFVRFCLSNKRHTGLEICLVKSPGYGGSIQENKKDIISFLNDDGTSNKFVANQYNFTIYNQTNKDRINKRIEQLKRLADNAVESYDEQDYINRISRLQQSSAIIYVGGITEKNAKEEFDRIEDAVGAVKSALKLGYVRGAGVELANIKTDNEVLDKILKMPLQTIFKNGNIKLKEIPQVPFNVKTKKEDSNLIDPTHVLISSLQNSFALAKLLINTSYIIHNEE